MNTLVMLDAFVLKPERQITGMSVGVPEIDVGHPMPYATDGAYVIAWEVLGSRVQRKELFFSGATYAMVRAMISGWNLRT